MALLGWVVVLGPAGAASLAALGAGATFLEAAAAFVASYLVGQTAMAVAKLEVEARYEAEVSALPATESVAEMAAAARVGLDRATLLEARAAAKVAVRAVLAARGAGLQALVARGRGRALAPAEAAAVVVKARESSADRSDEG